MGAEGGVCWIPLNPDATFDEAQKLLHPWWYTLTHIGSSDKDATRDAYILDATNLSHCVTGPYGDDGHEISLRDLEWWVDHIEHTLMDPTYGLRDGTFSDLLEEVTTRPIWLGKDNSHIMEWIRELESFLDPQSYKWVSDEDREQFRKLHLTEWLRGVHSVFPCISAHWEETWT